MEQLTKYRCAAGLTREAVAKICGVDRSTVTRWENGNFSPRTDKLPIIAKILGCTIDELLQEPKETTNN